MFVDCFGEAARARTMALIEEVLDDGLRSRGRGLRDAGQASGRRAEAGLGSRASFRGRLDLMENSVETFSDVTPSATPSDAEIAAWRALPRDEQLRRLQTRLTHPDCSTASDATMKDILARLQAADRLHRG